MHRTLHRTFTLFGKEIERVEQEKDLGIVLDKNLSFNEHVNQKVRKANSLLGLIKKSFVYMDEKVLVKLYKAIARPHLEYCNQVWHPYMKKQILLLENVQRRATRLVPRLRNLAYEERLKLLNLPSLEHRRRRGAVIDVYKFITGCFDPKVTRGMFQESERKHRGNQFQLKTCRSRLEIRRNFFTARVIKDWNELPNEVTISSDTTQFKKRLDQYWKEIENKTTLNI